MPMSRSRSHWQVKQAPHHQNIGILTACNQSSLRCLSPSSSRYGGLTFAKDSRIAFFMGERPRTLVVRKKGGEVKHELLTGRR